MICSYNTELNLFKFEKEFFSFVCSDKGEECTYPEELKWDVVTNPRTSKKIPKTALNAAKEEYLEYTAAIEWENSDEFTSAMAVVMENDTY